MLFGLEQHPPVTTGQHSIDYVNNFPYLGSDHIFTLGLYVLHMPASFQLVDWNVGLLSCDVFWWCFGREEWTAGRRIDDVADLAHYLWTCGRLHISRLLVSFWAHIKYSHIVAYHNRIRSCWQLFYDEFLPGHHFMPTAQNALQTGDLKGLRCFNVASIQTSRLTSVQQDGGTDNVVDCSFTGCCQISRKQDTVEKTTECGWGELDTMSY